MIRAQIGGRRDKERVGVGFVEKCGELQRKFRFMPDFLQNGLLIGRDGDFAGAPDVTRPGVTQAASAMQISEKIREVHGLADIFFIAAVFFFVKLTGKRGGLMRQQRDRPVNSGLIDND